MNARHPALAALLVTACGLAAAAETARPGDFGYHPATVHAGRPEVDASFRMYGHPASPRNAISHTNIDHPAVIVARGDAHAFDASTMRVGHPASPLSGEALERFDLATAGR